MEKMEEESAKDPLLENIAPAECNLNLGVEYVKPKRKRSSILKPPRSSHHHGEEHNDSKERKKRRRSSKRVSFAETFQVKEFLKDTPEADRTEMATATWARAPSLSEVLRIADIDYHERDSRRCPVEKSEKPQDEKDETMVSVQNPSVPPIVNNGSNDLASGSSIKNDKPKGHSSLKRSSCDEGFEPAKKIATIQECPSEEEILAELRESRGPGNHTAIINDAVITEKLESDSVTIANSVATLQADSSCPPCDSGKGNVVIDSDRSVTVSKCVYEKTNENVRNGDSSNSKSSLSLPLVFHPSNFYSKKRKLESGVSNKENLPSMMKKNSEPSAVQKNNEPSAIQKNNEKQINLASKATSQSIKTIAVHEVKPKSKSGKKSFQGSFLQKSQSSRSSNLHKSLQVKSPSRTSSSNDVTHDDANENSYVPNIVQQVYNSTSEIINLVDRAGHQTHETYSSNITTSKNYDSVKSLSCLAKVESDVCNINTFDQTEKSFNSSVPHHSNLSISMQGQNLSLHDGIQDISNNVLRIEASKQEFDSESSFAYHSFLKSRNLKNALDSICEVSELTSIPSAGAPVIHTVSVSPMKAISYTYKQGEKSDSAGICERVVHCLVAEQDGNSDSFIGSSKEDRNINMASESYLTHNVFSKKLHVVKNPFQDLEEQLAEDTSALGYAQHKNASKSVVTEVTQNYSMSHTKGKNSESQEIQNSSCPQLQKMFSDSYSSHVNYLKSFNSVANPFRDVEEQLRKETMNFAATPTNLLSSTNVYSGQTTNTNALHSGNRLVENCENNTTHGLSGNPPVLELETSSNSHLAYIKQLESQNLIKNPFKDSEDQLVKGTVCSSDAQTFSFKNSAGTIIEKCSENQEVQNSSSNLCTLKHYSSNSYPSYEVGNNQLQNVESQKTSSLSSNSQLLEYKIPSNSNQSYSDFLNSRGLIKDPFQDMKQLAKGTASSTAVPADCHKKFDISKAKEECETSTLFSETQHPADSENQEVQNSPSQLQTSHVKADILTTMGNGSVQNHASTVARELSKSSPISYAIDRHSTLHIFADGRTTIFPSADMEVTCVKETDFIEKVPTAFDKDGQILGAPEKTLMFTSAHMDMTFISGVDGGIELNSPTADFSHTTDIIPESCCDFVSETQKTDITEMSSAKIDNSSVKHKITLKDFSIVGVDSHKMSSRKEVLDPQAVSCVTAWENDVIHGGQKVPSAMKWPLENVRNYTAVDSHSIAKPESEKTQHFSIADMDITSVNSSEIMLCDFVNENSGFNGDTECGTGEVKYADVTNKTMADVTISHNSVKTYKENKSCVTGGEKTEIFTLADMEMTCISENYILKSNPTDAVNSNVNFSVVEKEHLNCDPNEKGNEKTTVFAHEDMELTCVGRSKCTSTLFSNKSHLDAVNENKKMEDGNSLCCCSSEAQNLVENTIQHYPSEKETEGEGNMNRRDINEDDDRGLNNFYVENLQSKEQTFLDMDFTNVHMGNIVSASTVHKTSCGAVDVCSSVKESEGTILPATNVSEKTCIFGSADMEMTCVGGNYKLGGDVGNGFRYDAGENDAENVWIKKGHLDKKESEKEIFTLEDKSKFMDADAICGGQKVPSPLKWPLENVRDYTAIDSHSTAKPECEKTQYFTMADMDITSVNSCEIMLSDFVNENSALDGDTECGTGEVKNVSEANGVMHGNKGQNAETECIINSNLDENTGDIYVKTKCSEPVEDLSEKSNGITFCGSKLKIPVVEAREVESSDTCISSTEVKEGQENDSSRQRGSIESDILNNCCNVYEENKSCVTRADKTQIFALTDMEITCVNESNNLNRDPTDAFSCDTVEKECTYNPSEKGSKGTKVFVYEDKEPICTNGNGRLSYIMCPSPDKCVSDAVDEKNQHLDMNDHHISCPSVEGGITLKESCITNVGSEKIPSNRTELSDPRIVSNIDVCGNSMLSGDFSSKADSHNSMKTYEGNNSVTGVEKTQMFGLADMEMTCLDKSYNNEHSVMEKECIMCDPSDKQNENTAMFEHEDMELTCIGGNGGSKYMNLLSNKYHDEYERKESALQSCRDLSGNETEEVSMACKDAIRCNEDYGKSSNGANSLEFCMQNRQSEEQTFNKTRIFNSQDMDFTNVHMSSIVYASTAEKTPHFSIADMDITCVNHKDLSEKPNSEPKDILFSDDRLQIQKSEANELKNSDACIISAELQDDGENDNDRLEERCDARTQYFTSFKTDMTCISEKYFDEDSSYEENNLEKVCGEDLPCNNELQSCVTSDMNKSAVNDNNVLSSANNYHMLGKEKTIFELGDMEITSVNEQAELGDIDFDSVPENNIDGENTSKGKMNDLSTYSCKSGGLITTTPTVVHLFSAKSDNLGENGSEKKASNSMNFDNRESSFPGPGPSQKMASDPKNSETASPLAPEEVRNDHQVKRLKIVKSRKLSKRPEFDILYRIKHAKKKFQKKISKRKKAESSSNISIIVQEFTSQEPDGAVCKEKCLEKSDVLGEPSSVCSKVQPNDLTHVQTNHAVISEKSENVGIVTDDSTSQKDEYIGQNNVWEPQMDNNASRLSSETKDLVRAGIGDICKTSNISKHFSSENNSYGALEISGGNQVCISHEKSVLSDTPRESSSSVGFDQEESASLERKTQMEPPVLLETNSSEVKISEPHKNNSLLPATCASSLDTSPPKSVKMSLTEQDHTTSYARTLLPGYDLNISTNERPSNADACPTQMKYQIDEGTVDNAFEKTKIESDGNICTNMQSQLTTNRSPINDAIPAVLSSSSPDLVSSATHDDNLNKMSSIYSSSDNQAVDESGANVDYSNRADDSSVNALSLCQNNNVCSKTEFLLSNHVNGNDSASVHVEKTVHFRKDESLGFSSSSAPDQIVSSAAPAEIHSTLPVKVIPSATFSTLPSACPSEDLPSATLGEVLPSLTPGEVPSAITPQEIVPSAVFFPPSAPVEGIPSVTTTKILPSVTSAEILSFAAAEEILPSAEACLSTTTEAILPPAMSEKVLSYTVPPKVCPSATAEVLSSSASAEVDSSTTTEEALSSAASVQVHSSAIVQKVIPPTTSTKVFPCATAEVLSSSSPTEILPCSTAEEVLSSSEPAEVFPCATAEEVLSSSASTEVSSSAAAEEVFSSSAPAEVSPSAAAEEVLSSSAPKVSPSAATKVLSSSALAEVHSSVISEEALSPAASIEVLSSAIAQEVLLTTPSEVFSCATSEAVLSSSAPTGVLSVLTSQEVLPSVVPEKVLPHDPITCDVNYDYDTDQCQNSCLHSNMEVLPVPLSCEIAEPFAVRSKVENSSVFGQFLSTCNNDETHLLHQCTDIGEELLPDIELPSITEAPGKYDSPCPVLDLTGKSDIPANQISPTQLQVSENSKEKGTVQNKTPLSSLIQNMQSAVSSKKTVYDMWLNNKPDNEFDDEEDIYITKSLHERLKMYASHHSPLSAVQPADNINKGTSFGNTVQQSVNKHAHNITVEDTDITVSSQNLLGSKKRSYLTRRRKSLFMDSGMTLFLASIGFSSNFVTSALSESEDLDLSRHDAGAKKSSERTVESNYEHPLTRSQTHVKHAQRAAAELKIEKECQVTLVDIYRHANQSQDYGKYIRGTAVQVDVQKEYPPTVFDIFEPVLKVAHNEKCLWEIKCLTEDKVIFAFMWNTLFLNIALTEEVDSPYIKRLSSITWESKIKAPTTGLGKLSHALFFELLGKVNLEENYPNTTHVLQLLECLSLSAKQAMMLVMDVEHVSVSHKFCLENNSELCVKVFSLAARTICHLRFPIDIATYPNAKIIPQVECLSGNNHSEKMLKAMSAVEPSSLYIWRMVQAVDSCFDSLIR